VTAELKSVDKTLHNAVKCFLRIQCALCENITVCETLLFIKCRNIFVICNSITDYIGTQWVISVKKKSVLVLT